MNAKSLGVRVLALVVVLSMSGSAFAADVLAARESRQVVVQSSEEVGSYELTPIVGENGNEVGFRVDVEDELLAESVVVNTETGEVSGFGITTRAILDAEGNPVSLVMSNGSYEVVLPGDVDMASLTPSQKFLLNRISKQFHAANGPARMARFGDIIQEVQAAQSSGRGIATEGWLNCAWGGVNIALDWVGVVAACGAPVVNGFACGFAVTWAVADTIKNAKDMATDCG
jgi:hypothetical protein